VNPLDHVLSRQKDALKNKVTVSGRFHLHRLLSGPVKAKSHYAVWSQTGPKLVFSELEFGLSSS